MDEYNIHVYPKFNEYEIVSVRPNYQQLFDLEYEYSVNGGRYIGFCSDIPKDEILKESTVESLLFRLLSRMRMPMEVHSHLIERVLQCAGEMLDDTKYHLHTLHICVEVSMTHDHTNENNSESDDTSEEEDSEVDSADERYDYDELVPAAKEFIKGLKIIEINECKRCSICFEDFVVGVCMPCLLMFHKNCIRKWLKLSNLCPLCRFKMPTDMN